MMKMPLNCVSRENRNIEQCKKEAGEGHFSIILPKRDNSGRKINTIFHESFIEKMNNHFGGSTTRPKVLGCYRDSKNRMQCEENILVESVRDFDVSSDLSKLDYVQRKVKLREDFEFLKRLGKEAGKKLGQETVMVQFDNVADISFVEGRRKETLSPNKLFDDIFAREI